MNINDFINNWLRPEVKFLIYQYTIYSPIKSELIQRFNDKKDIIRNFSENLRQLIFFKR